ncbi:3'-5' exoribonuclease YhaM family protein [Bacillus sp. FJAT-45350]|uniref:3'-5' exoribonuclease YhaM family protein n=1 Tax=Bacillus sp. FJAT-45350 TaxID=2011014 RepID=UPI000BB77D24|nr:3'-5' exoribonuclease YhaM family protein [Bacillus sp. FJAT-45350]
MASLLEKKEGERMVDFFIIKEREVSIASNGSEYISFTLGKGSETIRARIWDVSAEQKELFMKRSVVKVDATVTMYRNQKQLTIQRIRLATDEDPIRVQDLLISGNISREDLWVELRMCIEEIQSPVLSRMIKSILAKKEVRDSLTTIPAAKQYHHAYYAGLLEHIVSLCQGSLQLLPFYPHVDKDCVLASCILHDIGKTKALSDPIAPDYTTEGELVGHVVLGIEMVNEAAYEAGISTNNEEVVAVKHCMLCHYSDNGEELGGTVLGKTAEAIFFSQLDQLDTKMNALLQVKDSAEDGWSYSPMLKRRVFLKEQNPKE